MADSTSHSYSHILLDSLTDITPSLHPESLSTFAQCIIALKKPSYTRTPKDNASVIDSLKTFKYLMNTSDASASELEKSIHAFSDLIEYHSFSAGEVIFHKGEYDDQLYLTLMGNIVLFIEVAEDLFKTPDISTEISPIETPVLKPIQVKPTTDENTIQRNLFQPKTSKSILRRLTSLGDPSHMSESSSALKLLPTVHEVKRSFIEPHHPKERSPDHHRMSIRKSIIHENIGKEDIEAKKKMDLFKYLVKAEKSKPGKYIRDGRFLFKPKKAVGAGGHFGEKASRNSKIHTMTAIAVEDCHLIVFKLENYVKVFNVQLDDLNQNTRFLESFFPEASYPKLLKLADLFEERVFWHKQVVFEEGTPADALYLIKEGEAQLRKTLNPSQHLVRDERYPSLDIPKKKAYIASVAKGEALGEDDALAGEKRHYTAIVTSSKLVLWRLNMDVYNGISNVYQEQFSALRTSAKAKREFRKAQTKTQMNQMVQMAVHVNKLKKQASSTEQKSLLRISENMDTLFSIPDEQKVIRRSRARLDSPIKANRLIGKEDDDYRSGNKSVQETPVKSFINVTLSPLQRQSSIADSFDSSPLLEKFSLGSPKMDIDKIRHRSFLTTKLTSILEKQLQQINQGDSQGEISPSRKEFKGESSVSIHDGLTQSALYKEALGLVKKKRLNKSISKDKLTDPAFKVGDHKLYYDELKRSVQMIAKFGPRSPSPFEEGYISVNMSPISKLQLGENQEIVWDSVLGRNNADLKTLLPGSLAKDRNKNSVKEDLSFEMKQKGSKDSSSLDPTGRKPLIHLEKVKSSVVINKGRNAAVQTFSPMNDYDCKLRAVRDDSEEESQMVKSFVDGKSRGHLKISEVLEKLHTENVDNSAVRVGFKPSKLKLKKVRESGKGDVIVLGRKYSQN